MNSDAALMLSAYDADAVGTPECTTRWNRPSIALPFHTSVFAFFCF